MLAFVPSKVIIYRLCGVMPLLLFMAQGQAALPVRNQNPFAVLAGLPELKSPSKLANDEQIIGLTTTINSHFMDKTAQPSPLFIDGESYIGDFFWRRGIMDWEWEVIVPYISYQRGFMDSFVIRWHNALGLPNANRSDFANNHLLMSYGGELLDTPAQGPGDMRITAGTQLQKDARSQHALHLSIKLPTGDADNWLGSGSTDIGIFSSHAWQQHPWQEELQLGLLAMETPDIFPSQRRKLSAFMSSAVSYTLSHNWSVIVQYDAHTALYKDNQLSILGDGHIISLGSRWQWNNWRWHIALLEDIKVDSAPDVGFQMGFEIGNAPEKSHH